MFAAIQNIYPNFGPVAGGTDVTLFGSNLDSVIAIEMQPNCDPGCRMYRPITYDQSSFQNR